MFFGKSGSGKTQDGESEIGQVLAYTNDDIIIIDPKGDYKTITEEWKGNYYRFTQNIKLNKFIS